MDKKLFWLISIAVPTIIALSFFLFKFDGQITGFFRIGSEFPHSPYLNLDTAFIFAGERGHDGQQFLTIAFDPGLHHAGSIAALDFPAYRYRRILYPLLGYVLGFGQRSLIPYGMVLINVFALINLLYWTKQYLQLDDRPPWQALLILMLPSVWITLSLSTAELLSSTLLVTSLYFYQRGKFFRAGVFIALSCLTRETMLLMWAAIVIAAIWETDWERKTWPKILPLLGAGLPSVSWGLYTKIQFATDADTSVLKNFSYPFLGVVQKLQLLRNSELSFKQLYEMYSFSLLILVLILLVGMTVYNYQRPKTLFLCSLLITCLFLSLSPVVLGYYLDYSRVLVDAYLLLLLAPGLGDYPNVTSWARLTLLIGALPLSLGFLVASS
jgi:hypothetical protein